MKKSKPCKVYVMAVKTGKRQNDIVYFHTKKELEKAMADAKKKSIAFAVMVK